EREQASEALLKIGRSAKLALLEGLKHPDIEVQQRCQRLLISILEQDFKARLDAFIADKDGKQEHDLPSWKRYRTLIGDDSASRELFIEIVKVNRDLLQEADSAPKKAGDRLAGEIQTLFQRLFQPVPGDRRQLSQAEVAMVLFVASDPEVQ